MASDPFSVTGATQPIQSTGATGARAHPGSESRSAANATGTPNGRAESLQGSSARATYQTGATQTGQTDPTNPDQSRGVAATDTEKVEKLTEAVDKINEMMKQGQQMLTFQLDDESGRMVVRVIDAQSKEVVRQIPSEETLNFAKYVDGLVGLIFNKKA